MVDYVKVQNTYFLLKYFIYLDNDIINDLMNIRICIMLGHENDKQKVLII
jgi:hypothetical protein